MSSRCYIVLPRAVAFDALSDAGKEEYTSLVVEKLEFITSIGLRPTCFKEDILAFRLLHKYENIRWLSLVGTADSYFMGSDNKDLPAKWFDFKCDSIDKAVIKQSVERFKTTKLRTLAAEVAVTSRREILYSRIRMCSNVILGRAEFVCFFTGGKGQNYCNDPTETPIGGGKMRITVLQDKHSFYYFGGVRLDKDNFAEAVRRLYGQEDL